MNGIKYVKCQVCGKQDKAENLMLIGGCFVYLCPSCRKVVNKVVPRILEHLRELPFEIAVQTIMKKGANGGC